MNKKSPEVAKRKVKMRRGKSNPIIYCAGYFRINERECDHGDESAESRA